MSAPRLARLGGRAASGVGAERRRDRRYQIDLPAELVTDRDSFAVLASDISASGALVVATGIEDRLAIDDGVILQLTDFEPLRARVAHVGAGFSGLEFQEAHLHRDRLVAWLRAEVGSP